jgi:hypothetical protein
MDSKDMAKYMKERRLVRRATLIEMLGSKCSECGSTNDLEIDHIDPNKKEFGLSGKGLDTAWEVILQEVTKCQILCKEHHILKTAQDVFPSHGTMARYRHRKSPCNCQECRDAYNTWRREWRKKRKLVGKPSW